MNTVGTLAARDYISRLRSRSFIIGTILGVLGIVSLSFISVFFNLLGLAFTPSLILIGPDPGTTQSLQKALADDYKVTASPIKSSGTKLPDSIKQKVVNGSYDAALVAYRTTGGILGFAYYPAKSSSLETQDSLRRLLLRPVVAADFAGKNAAFAQRAINFPFSTTSLSKRYKSAAEAGLAQGLVYFLLLLLYISVIMYGVYVAQGVIEEKSNRIMEIMIAVVRPNQLLAGKIVGIGALALSQMLFFAVVAVAMIFVGKSATTAIATVPGSTIGYLLVFFLLGFFSYATMFAGVGALSSKAEDVQQSNSLLIMPIIAAYFLSIIALQDPDKPFLVWASMVPLISPMLMFTRVATSSVPFWQVAVSIGASLLAIWLFTILAAKLYRVGVLMYGKPLSPKEIWRALRAPS